MEDLRTRNGTHSSLFYHCILISSKSSIYQQTHFISVLENIKIYYVEIKCQLDATDYIYCRFYCMLNMYRAILCPSLGTREYYTDGRCLRYLVLWFSGCRYGVELKVVCPVCRLQQQQPANRTHNLQLHTIPTT